MKKYLIKSALLIATVLFATSSLLSHAPVQHAQAAGKPTIYLSLAARTATVGDIFVVHVRINTPVAVNAGFVYVAYDKTKLRVTKAPLTGVNFSTQNAAPGGDPKTPAVGYVYMENTKLKSPWTGDLDYAAIYFQAIAPGNATASIRTDSKLANYTTGGTVYSYPAYNVAGLSYTINARPVTPPPPVAPPPIVVVPDGNDDAEETTTVTGSSSDNSNVADEEPVDSAVSADGQQISDLSSADEDYHSVVVTWKTAKPSTSKVNYGTDQNDLNNEQKSDASVTDHSVTIKDGVLKAGTRYFIRATADDGPSAVTADSEFTTKAVPIVVKVTDSSNQAVPDATVSSGDASETTDSNGEATIGLPEGEVKIRAEKDDFSSETTQTIKVPKDETPKQIGMVLSKTTTAAPAQKSKAGLLLIFLIIPIAVLIWFLIRRVRRAKKLAYYGDALDTENYPMPQQ